MNDSERPADQFVRELAELAPPEPGARHNRAALAALRRGVRSRDGWDPAAARVVYNALPPGINEYRENPYFQVAALFALHPVVAFRADQRSQPFTTALLALVQEEVRGGKEQDDVRAPLDRRVSALLDAHPDDVMVHLRHFVRRFDGTDIPVDWAQLIEDLAAWDRPDQRVQRRWARAWWNSPGWIDSTTAGEHADAEPTGHL